MQCYETPWRLDGRKCYWTKARICIIVAELYLHSTGRAVLHRVENAHWHAGFRGPSKVAVSAILEQDSDDRHEIAKRTSLYDAREMLELVPGRLATWLEPSIRAFYSWKVVGWKETGRLDVDQAGRENVGNSYRVNPLLEYCVGFDSVKEEFVARFRYWADD